MAESAAPAASGAGASAGPAFAARPVAARVAVPRRLLAQPGEAAERRADARAARAPAGARPTSARSPRQRRPHLPPGTPTATPARPDRPPEPADAIGPGPRPGANQGHVRLHDADTAALADGAGGPAPLVEQLEADVAPGEHRQLHDGRQRLVATPAWPPTSTPPASYPPSGDLHDAEGNLVRQASSGAWYLASRPELHFPIAAGYRYELLPLNPDAAWTVLRAECVRVRDQQQAAAARLKGDGKYWFARVYYFVTLHELQNIDRGVYQYPHMKMQEVIQFNNTYAANLAAWEHGRQAEPNWRAAFGAAEDSESLFGSSWSIKNAMLPAMEAHIRFDLPRAIAAVYELHYAGLPGVSLSAFRADFFAMSGVFAQAKADLSGEIDAAGTKWNPDNWDFAADALFPLVFSVPQEREMAWEKAAVIVSSSGRSSAATEQGLHSQLRGAHPNWRPFDVDDSTVRGYAWQHQPGARPDSPPRPASRPAPLPPDLPRRLYFKLNRPNGDTELAAAVRPDQDLRPLLGLASWLRQVSGAVIVLDGHASAEGDEDANASLSGQRGSLLEYFLFRAGADLTHNKIVQLPAGARGAAATREWRYVGITVAWPGYAKQAVWGTTSRLPSEVP